MEGLAFVCFTLLYMPCVATMAAVRREVGAGRALVYMLTQTAVAWVVGCLVFQVGSLLL